MPTGMIRLICAVLCVLLLALIVLRRCKTTE